MNERELMQAEILLLFEQLGDSDIESILNFTRQRSFCGAEGLACASCELTTAAEACKLLLSMDKWERKGYLRWMKAKHPEIMPS